MCADGTVPMTYKNAGPTAAQRAAFAEAAEATEGGSHHHEHHTRHAHTQAGMLTTGDDDHVPTAEEKAELMRKAMGGH